VICGETEQVEMHHVRSIKALRDKKSLDFFTKQIALINRKQVPLCEEHHHKLHTGRFTDRERAMFAQGCQSYIKAGRKQRKLTERIEEGGRR